MRGRGVALTGCDAMQSMVEQLAGLPAAPALPVRSPARTGRPLGTGIVQCRIAMFLKAQPDCVATRAQLAELFPGQGRTTVDSALGRMEANGQVEHLARGLWGLVR